MTATGHSGHCVSSGVSGEHPSAWRSAPIANEVVSSVPSASGPSPEQRHRASPLFSEPRRSSWPPSISLTDFFTSTLVNVAILDSMEMSIYQQRTACKLAVASLSVGYGVLADQT
ncbi:hypothetical protein M6B38_348805 [Iris pallida]|uniref:Uncharacterized protein n=1 Tax=Iris pallida TaxID=29817 RepID=A0AAX6GT82_IRIPA|nr:hypothetical protein M6B38_348805 [Iris pallida]